jgi:solute carrier family 35 protein E1
MVPHATTAAERRSSSSRFPDFISDPLEFPEDAISEDISRGPSPGPLPNGLPAGLHSSERWPARKDSNARSWASWASNGRADKNRKGRQKSLSEAIRTVRERKMSISQNAHEIAESLKAPVSFKLVVR